MNAAENGKKKLIIAIAALSAAGAIGVDLFVRQGYTEWPLYLAPVFFAGFLRENFWIIAAAVIASTLALIGYVYPGSEDIDSAIVIFHRAFAVFHIWFLTFILFAKNRAIGYLRTAVAQQKEARHKLKDSESDLRALTASLEDRVTRRTQQVHALSKALTVAEQRERLHFSQVLHDDLQQILFSAKMRLDVIEESISPEGKQDLDELSGVGQLIDKATDTARSLALELNPPILKNEGFDASLQWLTRHMAQRYGLSIETRISPEVTDVGEVDRILIIQLVRELLFNVVRHAKTKDVSIEAEKNGKKLRIVVKDRGVGFDADAVRDRQGSSKGMGIFSIEERLRLFGGNLEIESERSRGTTATILLPVNL